MTRPTLMGAIREHGVWNVPLDVLYAANTISMEERDEELERQAARARAERAEMYRRVRQDAWAEEGL